MVFADELGIAEPQITLLDKKFSPQAQERFESMNFSGERKEADIFQFLNDSPTNNYDLVSVIGMEHVFNSPERIEQLASGLARTMNPGGVAFAFPTRTRTDVTSIWDTHGFLSLSTYPGPDLLGRYVMIYQPPALR